MTAPPPSAPATGAGPRRILIRLKESAALPSAFGTLLAAVVLFLVVFGLVMVLSASSVESFTDGNGFFGRFGSQGGYAVLGVVLMVIVARLPRRTVQRVAVVVLVLSCVLQILALATPLGVKIGDNTNWIRIGPIAGQPSEGIKLGLVIWLGMMLGRRPEELQDWRTLARRIVPVAGPALLLVVLGGDLGTTVVMAAFTLGALYFAGVRLKHLGVVLGAGAFVAILIALSSATRRGRISAFFGGTSAVNPDVNWQVDNAHYALASGGLWGVGLGNSHAKWSWLPSADTDFIFAVIGEELGLIGACVVLLLFAMLAVLMVRLVRTTPDPVVRITTGTVLVWLIFQAFVNIGVVLGLIPTLGVPLPFISAGGTALIASLVAMGVVLSYTRRPPRSPLDGLDRAHVAAGRAGGDVPPALRRPGRRWPARR
ncbi:FtsW/RodA/SpoVE family cell cycle protein [Leifsonia naganoensis]|uniref:Probable peptidoglycan glycosyltransferase FtsW n=1 Tax=Leifsonia naganoensis TaxID=150025 RepID=A0A853DU65_9MICO|nr:putative peptidoglycan glycosyltransferase FtsW [Leifsonia naganoensis]NYK11233.1 UDP-N-acetylglucosamine--N-acetylmuramyl-(pentapeptide) pyrophosphoryl-undecaprenol N-acetylglucosamine transferase/cell division protein FtsW [Leifsonia naganoensis]